MIVHGEAFGRGGDESNMDPMLKDAEENLKAVGHSESLQGKVISADTSYFSVNNLKSCQEHEVNAYVPDPRFRQRDPRFADAQRHRRPTDKRKEEYKSKKRFFTPSDFKMDDEKGKLICPAGEEMYVKNRNFKIDGKKAIAYQAKKSFCSNCELRSKCLRNPNTVARQVHMFYGERTGSLTDEMRQKIDTVEGRSMYSKRLGIVEPVFANMCTHKGMDKFTLRGKLKVNLQWLIYCMVHNLDKIANFGVNYAATG